MTKAAPKPPSRTRPKEASAERNSVHTSYLWIKEQILSGRFTAGEVLPQGALARQCKTSRGPIREALRLLQNQGLIEAETNQRARVASFSALDLEEITASMIINAGAAIAYSSGKWSPADFRRMGKLANELQALGRPGAASDVERSERTAHRQLVYRNLVMELCSHGGKPVQHILEAHFDRIVIFRQMAALRTGSIPDFPLSATIEDLQKAIALGDVRAIALALAHRMAELGRSALERMGVQDRHTGIDDALAFVVAALGGDLSPFRRPEIRTHAGQTILISHDDDGALRWRVDG